MAAAPSDRPGRIDRETSALRHSPAVAELQEASEVTHQSTDTLIADFAAGRLSAAAFSQLAHAAGMPQAAVAHVVRQVVRDGHGSAKKQFPLMRGRIGWPKRA